MFKGRFPRVSFRAEIPFIFGLTCVFGMWTKMHHGLMLAHPDPFTHVKKSEGGSDDIDISFWKELEQQEAEAKK